MRRTVGSPNKITSEVKIKLELIDSSGRLIETHFNPSERTVILE